MSGDDNLVTEATSRLMDSAFIRKVIGDLCDLWDQAADDKRVFRGELDAATALSIHAHAHHAVRLARSILVLDDSRLSAGVIPVARLLLECGVTAAWLLVTTGSGRTLIRDGAESRRKALVEVAAIGESVSPGYEQALETLKNLEDASKAFDMPLRCNSLQGGKQLYVLYRVLSAESHAGMGIADRYSVEEQDSPIGLAFNTDPVFETRTSTLGISACMLLLAINADELARARPHRTTQIAKLAKRLHVGVRIIRKDGFEMPPRG